MGNAAVALTGTEERAPERVPAILEKAIAEAIAEARNDGRRAAVILADRIMADAALLKAFRTQIVRACGALVHRQIAQERRAVVRGAHVPLNAAAGEANARARRVVSEGLLYFPLPIRGYPLLKDATAEQMESAAHFYEAQGKTSLVRAAWLGRVAELKRAGKEITEKKLRALYEEAESDA